jgi:NAD(P)-dependent dehydrogenase (short-subunit alcohol dehydrogenase family)
MTGGALVAGQFTRKVALITGAGSGIGRATALAFAREGAFVVVSDAAIAGGEETVRLIEAAAGEATFIATDVTKPDEVQQLIQRVVESYGHLDYAHNNAGIALGGLTHEMSVEDWTRVIGVNLTGVWLCLKHEIAQMLRQGGGAIVNTASVAGLIGHIGLAAYVASKHGVVGLTRTAALECAQQNIRINAVCPGYIRTPMSGTSFGTTEQPDWVIAKEPIGRFGEPAEVAAAVVWLCSDAASFVTGVAFPVDGGWIAQ